MQAHDLAVAGRELVERALEVVAGLGVVERRAVADDVLVELDEDHGPALVEALRLPLDHLVDDDAEGDAVAPAALELGEEADDDRRARRRARQSSEPRSLSRQRS